MQGAFLAKVIRESPAFCGHESDASACARHSARLPSALHMTDHAKCRCHARHLVRDRIARRASWNRAAVLLHAAFRADFAIDMPDPKLARHEALMSYRLGLNMIANARWLQRKVLERSGCEAERCPNAIDYNVFHNRGRPARSAVEVRIISYGGRNASWKGLRDMAPAVRSVRLALPHRKIRWLVYGESLLPPDDESRITRRWFFCSPRPCPTLIAALTYCSAHRGSKVSLLFPA